MKMPTVHFVAIPCNGLSWVDSGFCEGIAAKNLRGHNKVNKSRVKAQGTRLSNTENILFVCKEVQKVTRAQLCEVISNK